MLMFVGYHDARLPTAVTGKAPLLYIKNVSVVADGIWGTMPIYPSDGINESSCTTSPYPKVAEMTRILSLFSFLFEIEKCNDLFKS